MIKFDSVAHAVWIAAAIMSYNAYKQSIKDGELVYGGFYFKQSEIVNNARNLCNTEVANARVSQWFNGNHTDNMYNFLTAKDKLRRLAYKNEYNGVKEKPEGLILSNLVDTDSGEITIEELIKFVDNGYTNYIISEEKDRLEMSEINYKEILDFLKDYSGSAYANPDNSDNEIEKQRLLTIKAKAQSALNQFKAIGDLFKPYGYIYEKSTAAQWLLGNRVTVRDYFWLELKKTGKETFPSSISIVAEKVENFRFTISLEIRDNKSDERAYLRHFRYLDRIDVDNQDFEYFFPNNTDLTLDNLSKDEIKNFIEKVRKREENKIQIGKTLSYEYICNSNNEEIEKIIKEEVEKLEPYYDLAVEGDNYINPEDEIGAINDEGEKYKVTMEDNKNLILYGPPGTGKTYNVINKALEIINPLKYKGIIKGKLSRDEIVKEFNRLLEIGQISFCTFHQSYSYEDFVEGLRSDDKGNFVPKDGIFKQACNSASLKNEDGFSKYDFDESKIDFHKMSLGDTNSGDDSIFEYCLKNNCVALGWGEDINYSNCKNQEDIKKEFFNVNSDAKNNDFNITAINRFMNWIKKDDIIIISYGNYKARAIAKVTGDYYYDPNTEIGFSHFRKVQWLYKNERIEVDRILKNKSFSQQSIYMFYKEDLNIDSIKELISTKEISDEEKKYILIIDEINRGNISKIFGELITLIEEDKRIGRKNEIQVTLPYSNKKFGVPNNLYIIGTMNTADRSIALLDTALRRRFEFIEYMPNPELLPEDIEGINLKEFLKVLNQRIEFLFDRDHTIGHAYFIRENLTFESIVEIMKKKVIPLLEEYFYGDYEKIELILGGAGNLGNNNYFLAKEEGNPVRLFNKRNISNEYPSQYKYKVVENPSKEAFLNLYSNIEDEA